jgi:hypothetical protein
LAAHPRWAHRAAEATGWRRWLAAVHLGITAIRNHPGGVPIVLGAGLAFQIAQCLSIWMAAQVLDMNEVTVMAAFAFFPPTLIAQNLPVGFGGLGIREGAFLLFFGALGATDERAVALGLLTYLVTMVTSAIGAPFLAAGGKPWREALAADRAEAAAAAAEAIAAEEAELDHSLVGGDADDGGASA